MDRHLSKPKLLVALLAAVLLTWLVVKMRNCQLIIWYCDSWISRLTELAQRTSWLWGMYTAETRCRVACLILMSISYSQSAAVVAAKKKQWCVTCSVIANPRCKAQKHMLCCFSEVLSKDLTLIKGRAGKCSELWNDAIEERNRAHNVYSEILGSLQCLEVIIPNPKVSSFIKTFNNSYVFILTEGVDNS